MARFVNIAGGVGLALAMSQFPEYSQQYVQRLGGAVEELTTVVRVFDTSAKLAGMSRDEALLKLSGTEFLERRQRDMRETFERQERLSADYSVLRDADAYNRVVYISRLTDKTLTKRTWRDFQPAVPLTLDGLVFTLGGYLAGYGAFGGVFAAMRRGRSRGRLA